MDIKLIVWDLDGVLWESSVGETGSTGQVNHQVIDFIKHSEQSGIIHSVCSKNDLVKVKTILEELDIWDLFVFPAIDYTPKGPTVNKIIESCQLSQFNVLFVDDNDININEVKYFSPDINTENNVDFIKSFNMPTGKSRTDQYKILEIKAVDRDNITYLKGSQKLTFFQIHIRIGIPTFGWENIVIKLYQSDLFIWRTLYISRSITWK